MAVTEAEVRRIAGLAKLHFEDPDLKVFTIQFQRILDYVEKLREVDVAGIDPASHLVTAGERATHAMRDDQVRPSLTPEEALSNAPDSGRSHFKVPRVI
jgi:aspartyl-tRNA(Asn)/glutamyl-tRNA(Gln) amidotransferase subunit C